MSFDVRPSRDRDEFVRAFYSIGQYFGAVPEPERIDRALQIVELERMHAAFDGDEIVGGAAAFTYDFSVPGGSLPCAGVTMVGVYPTHRRRGVLRSMMQAQLADVHERGEPIAALWASEETIYGRFGYGIAAWACELTLARVWSAFAQPLERRGQVRFVSAEEAAELFPPVWEALRRDRPGVPSRSEAWWKLRTLRIPDEEKANPRRFVALDLDGSTQAYAIYRREPAWQDGVSNAKLDVNEAIGTTPQATAEIWRYLLDVDWTETIDDLRASDRPSALPAARDPAPREVPDGRLALGAARRRRRRPVGAGLRSRRLGRLRGARPGVPVERRPVGGGGRRSEANGRGRGHRPRRRRARLGVPGSRVVRAPASRPAAGGVARGSGGEGGRAIRVAPAPLVPGDLLATMPIRRGG